ncbi:aquaporin Z [Labedella phragmitis]|uniref:Aquaporin Z n=1 Tax=Labedella phragmitis TaxID=2498849 RepID=A0A3S5CBX1_9MICO|nr:aquaporin [Labedella phragmitis]RWZ46381.1 aquaporin Z [Labedella phragmitis]
MTGSHTEPRFAAVVGAETLGTFVVTAVFVGSSVIGGAVLGTMGLAVATGFALLAVVATLGRVSGAHVNPAVTVGLAVAGRFPWRDVSTYLIAQLVGATLGAGLVLAVVADGPPGALQEAQRAGFASGGFGYEGSPDGYGLVAVALVETLATALLVAVYCSVAPRAARPGASGVAASVIGATLVAMTLVALPVSNASFNPARSFATALFAGPDRISQLWAFVLFPLVGAIIAALAVRLASRSRSEVEAG